MVGRLSKAAFILLAGVSVSVVVAMLSESQRNRLGMAWATIFKAVSLAALAAMFVRMWAERLENGANHGIADDVLFKLSLPDYTPVRVTRVRPEIERQALGFPSSVRSLPQVGDVGVIIDRDHRRSLYVVEKVRDDGSSDWLACFAEDELVPLTNGQAG